VTRVPGPCTIDDLRPSDAAACGSMTFPAYRHLLALDPEPRLPAEPEQRVVQPLGAVARESDIIVGLGLAEAPTRPGDGPPELLSLFVALPHRGRGLATGLVEAIEDGLRGRGFPSVEATYTTGKPSIAAVERVFAKRGWDPPQLRTISVRFTLKEAVSTPWYGRVGLPKGAELFSWSELTPEERTEIRESNRRAPWIPNSLQPWRHDALGFDPVSSVGLRYRGEVVGWMINHRMDARTVRFTCSFLRTDLSRRARILPLYSEAIRRLAEDGCEFGTFVTPTVYPGMVEFIHQHIEPYVTFTGETRGTKKRL
jgi:GNAT superfamily N-acetyltransferase